MPRYSYLCDDCQKRFSVTMSYEEYGKNDVTCPFCGSAKVHRRIGRVRFARSAESRLDNFADLSESDLEGIEDDPRAMAGLMRRMKSEMGDELGDDVGPEFDEVVGRLEAGQSPEDIEKDLPDLGGDNDFDTGGDF